MAVSAELVNADSVKAGLCDDEEKTGRGLQTQNVLVVVERYHLLHSHAFHPKTRLPVAQLRSALERFRLSSLTQFIHNCVHLSISNTRSAHV